MLFNLGPLQLVNYDFWPGLEEKQPCLSFKLNWGHCDLLSTNDNDDDEIRPFYLLSVGKRDGR